MLHLLPVIRATTAILLVGNFLIIFHEMGHFLTARLFGIRATRVAIGVGPTLWSTTDRRGTAWSLSLLPLGGFVSFHSVRDASDPRSYAAQRPQVRMAIIAAGPAANILVAIAVFTVMFAATGIPAFLPVATSIVPGSAAARSGLQPGDRILALDGKPVAVFDDMRPILAAGPGKTIDAKVQRHGQVLDLFPGLGSITVAGKTIGVLGIRSIALTHIPLTPGEAVVQAAEETWSTIADMVTGITRAVTRGQGTQNFAGIVGIAHLTGQAADAGMATLLALIGILSTNLALMNLLPIPILDGGALLLCLAEVALHRPLSARVQNVATGAGVATLATLFMLSTVHDLDTLGLFRWLAQL